MKITIHAGGQTRTIDYGPRKLKPMMSANPLYSASAEAALVGIAYSEEDFKDLPVSEVSLKDLTSPQPGIMAKDSGRLGTMPAVHVVRKNGQYILWDGNHRAYHSLRSGESMIPARILEADAIYIHQRTWRKPEGEES